MVTTQTIGERVKQLRKYFKQTQATLGQAIGMTRGNISKIENNTVPPSSSFLKVLKERFSVNPDWIKTGAGEMFIAPEEYIANGIKFLGVQKYGQGLIKIFDDPKFEDLKALVAIDRFMNDDINDELNTLLHHVAQVWREGDERARQMLTQLVRAFPEVGGKTGRS